MTCDAYALATAGVQGLSPYQPGKPIEELQRELGLGEVVKLASNENPLGPGSAAREAAARALEDAGRYPDGGGFRLKRALAERLAVDSEAITLGNGSNDVLEMIARAFVTTRHEVVFSAHAFAVYPLVTRAVGATAVVVPAREHHHDPRAMAAAITPRTRLVFVANPNNPTGGWLSREALAPLLAAVPSHALLVLDEAYCEYVTEPEYPDGVALLASHPNLIVTRTFSKVYGLAGLRVGYAVSSPAVADILNRVRQPFNVNAAGLAAAEAALADEAHVRRSVEANLAGKAQLVEGLGRLGFDFIPGVGNFICVEVGDAAAKLYDALLHEGVIVRPLAGYDLPRHLRVTIGTAAENARFLAALARVAGR